MKNSKKHSKKPIFATLTGKIFPVADNAEIGVFTFKVNGELDYVAGQYALISVEDRPAQAFSIAEYNREKGEITLHLKNSGQGISAALFTAHQGKEICIESIQGKATLDHNSNRPIIMIAGGVGFAPFHAMIKSIEEQAAINPQKIRPIHLYIGGRRPQDLYFISITKNYKSFVTTTIALSDPAPQNHDFPIANIGDLAIKEQGDRLKQADIYIAGAPLMVQDILTKLATMNIDPKYIFCDMKPPSKKSQQTNTPKKPLR